MPQAETITGRTEEWWPRIDQRLAVLIPCFNEETAIARVIAGFRAELPEATIYVYDNNSTDNTLEVARAAGAVVRRETHQGKGLVVRRMFADVEADIYVLVDGDATYDACSVRAMIARQMEERLDMVVAARVEQEADAYRPGHRMGNRLFTGFFASVFDATFTDILSGYRVFSRRFVKSFPVLSRGFEIETELSVHALELDLPVGEVPTPYYARPEGSSSKLSTWRDGLRILLHHRRALPLGAAADVLLRTRHRFGGRFRCPFGSDLRDLFRGRHRPAPSDRDPVHRAHAVGLSLDRRRSGARHGDPRAAGNEADRLSAAPRAPRSPGPARNLRRWRIGRAPGHV